MDQGGAVSVTPGGFLADLAGVRLDGVFNPYADRCPDHDRAGAPQRRRRNLEAALCAAWAARGGSVWIARDLGYRGGRRTGLPLTDEVRLRQFSAAWGGLSLRKATAGPAVGERTAAIVWDMLRRVGRPVFLWNLFPLHPYGEGSPMSNRRHTAAERRIGERFLATLLEALQPATLVAIGNDAAGALQRLGLDHAKVRHPSYGGQASFCAGIAGIYGLARQDTDMARRHDAAADPRPSVGRGDAGACGAGGAGRGARTGDIAESDVVSPKSTRLRPGPMERHARR